MTGSDFSEPGRLPDGRMETGGAPWGRWPRRNGGEGRGWIPACAGMTDKRRACPVWTDGWREGVARRGAGCAGATMAREREGMDSRLHPPFRHSRENGNPGRLHRRHRSRLQRAWTLLPDGRMEAGARGGADCPAQGRGMGRGWIPACAGMTDRRAGVARVVPAQHGRGKGGDGFPPARE